MNNAGYLTKKFGVSPKVIDYISECEQQAAAVFGGLEETTFHNQLKVMDAFRINEVSTRHFSQGTGYGYGEEGRDKLCRVFADAMGAQEAIVSPLIMSGTHAISMSLFGLLRPGDSVLAIAGEPYDTMKSAINGGDGSLRDFDIDFQVVPLKENLIDIRQVLSELKEKSFQLIYIQRSTGYDIRPAYTVSYIGEIIKEIKTIKPDITIFVDNCYGEFVNELEPVQVGADLMAGSLIKNPGGGLAPTGGYIVGRSDLVEKVSGRYSVPGIGMEIGSYAFGYQQFYQGLFMAPHTVLQALKGVVLASLVFENLGYETLPKYSDARGDITQTISFGSEEPLTAFVRSIQKASPVDGHVVPYAWDMPGYDDKVIMAAGTFVQGASLELTADAPIREPFCAYLQGALTYEHAKIGILLAVNEIMK